MPPSGHLLQLVYPSGWLGQGGLDPSPLGVGLAWRADPHWVLCFRKAASATCPFRLPLQVGHPATSPCPALGVALRRPVCHRLEPRPASSGNVLSPAWPHQAPGSCGRGLGRGPAGSGLKPQQGNHRVLALQPLQGAFACLTACFLSQAGSARPTRRSCHPQWGSTSVRCGAVCVRVCGVKPRGTGVAGGLCGEMQGALASPLLIPQGLAERLSWTQRSPVFSSPGCLGDTQFSFRIRQCGGQRRPGHAR